MNTVKKDSDFPVPSRDVPNQTLRGRPERVCLVTSRLGTGKSLTVFYNEVAHLLPDLGPVRLGEVPLLLVVVPPLLLLLLDGSLSQPFLNNQTVINSYRQPSAPSPFFYWQGVTNRCRLSWLTNSNLVYEP
jgi:hypothetical protein